jgi:large subunit ribosomal protein L18
MKILHKTAKAMRLARKARIAPKVKGNDKRVRVGIFVSNTQISAQAFDDIKGLTIVSTLVKGKTIQHAKDAGKTLGELLLKRKIVTCTFDRAGFRYHGRIKAFVESLRELGIKV